MERARIGLRIATIASLVAIVYAAVVHAAANAVGLVMFMPDELNAYHMLVTLGFADAWHGYWEGLIGRVSAIGLLLAELWVIDSYAPSPWIGVVAARGLNHLLVFAAFFVALRIGITGLGNGRSAILAVCVQVAAQVAAGTSGIVGTWLLDHSIYLLSAATLPVVAAYVSRHLVEGLEPHEAWMFAAVYAVFLGAHEINLVAGGGILAVVTLAHWRQMGRTEAIGRPRDSVPAALSAGLRARFDAWRARRAQDKSIRRERRFVVLCGSIYAICAALQVLSPSVAFRRTLWPSKLPLFPDAFVVGIETLTGIAKEMFGAFPPTIAAAGLAGAALGFAAGAAGRIETRTAALFASLLVVMSAVTLVTMATLSATIGYALEGGVFLPPHQRIYTGLLLSICAGAGGAAAGSGLFRILPAPDIVRSAPVALAACVLAFGVLSHPVHWHVSKFLLFAGTINYGEDRYGAAARTNNFSEYRRLDLQLRVPTAGRVAYGDEINLFTPRAYVFEPSYRAFYESDAFGLSTIYRLREVVFVPCELGARKDVCNGIDGRISHRRVTASTSGSIEASLTSGAGIRREKDRHGVRMMATHEAGEHFAAFEGPTGRGEVALRVEVVAADPAPGTRFALYAISGGVTALQLFDLTGATLGPSAQSSASARVFAASIRREADGAVRLKAGFALSDGAEDFSLRLQLATETYTTIFERRPDLGVSIRALDISIVNP